jgi:hypothetical protein
MPDTLSHWIMPFVPAMMMLTIVILNHFVAGQRNDKKTAGEASRFSAALAAELRAMLDLYKMNLDLIDKKADYILSTRSSIVVYKGNLGRLTALLDKPAIEHVVAVFAQNERIEAVVAAHSNFKCNLTYQFSPVDTKFEEWKLMYEQASDRIAAACRILDGYSESDEPLNNVLPWRAVLDQFFNRTRNVEERRWSVR